MNKMKGLKLYGVIFLLIIGIKMLTGETNSITITIGISALLAILIIIIMNFMKYRKEESPKIQQVDELGKELFKQTALFHNFAKKEKISDEVYRERLNHAFTAAYMFSFAQAKISQLFKTESETGHFFKSIFPKNVFELIQAKMSARLLADDVDLSKVSLSDEHKEKMQKFNNDYDEGLICGAKESKLWDKDKTYIPHYLSDFLRNGKIPNIENHDKETKKPENTKKYTEKEMYFIKKIHFIESIKKALDLSEKNKYKESNQIYDELISHRGDDDIEEYFESIFANKGWNYIELGLFNLAETCFNEGMELNAENKIILDGMQYIKKFHKK